MNEEEALKALAERDLSLGFIFSQTSYGGYMDFARCQRSDGSFYGTSGQCRKGKEVGAKQKEEVKKVKKKDKEVKKEGSASPASSPKITPEEARKKSAEVVKKIGKLVEERPDNWLDQLKELKSLREYYDSLSSDPSEKEELDLQKQMKKRRAKTPPKVELDEKTKSSIKAYTTDYPPKYKDINKCARKKGECDEETKKMMADMDSAILKMPKNESGGSHFRGVYAGGATLESLQKLKPGDSFVDQAFGSYSRNLEIANTFAETNLDDREYKRRMDTASNRRSVIIESRSKELRSVEQTSDIKKEQEAVLPRGVPQKVVEVKEVNQTLYIVVE